MVLLLQVCYVMRETSCCLFLAIIKLILLKHSTIDDLIYIDYPYFEQMVSRIYPTYLQLNETNSFDTEAPFLGFDLSITNDIVSSKR